MRTKSETHNRFKFQTSFVFYEKLQINYIGTNGSMNNVSY